MVTAFRECVARAPAAIAVRTANEALSYGELEQRSNRMAHALAARGVTPGARVAALADRGAETIVAFLAILKVGAAYAPLDPTYPDEQRAYMLADLAPALVLASAQYCDLAPGAVALDAFARQAAAFSGEAFACAASGESAAYVMYTSGSTGRPKGVIATHRGVTRLVRDQDYASFAQDEVFLHLAPLPFDASTFEIWGALLNGAQVAIVEAPRPSLDDICDAIATLGATTAWFTAGLFHVLVDHKLEGLRPLRQILAGGDVLSPDHTQRALQKLPHCRLINGYGPTESTTFTCCHTLRQGDTGPVPIGRAIAHTRVSIRDEALRPVAEGETGQLCIGGDGLALGYLNAPDLTREKFVADPLNPNERLYLSGDLVRETDGVFAFLGRADAQVKIDGKRVDLGEIESWLRQHPSIADAAVTARAHGALKRIAAFVVPAGGWTAGDDRAVLGWLRTHVPAHMLPSSVTALAALPLNANGKVDRKALQEPEAQRASHNTVDTGTLAHVRATWTAVLGLSSESVSPSANFFDLGGTSLRLLEAHARLQTALGRKIDLVKLFEHANAGALARWLDGAAEAPHARPASRAPAASDEIAIIGMAGRFPGARDIGAFWQNICAGADSISRFTDGELEDAFDATTRASDNFVKARSVLDGADMFDAEFFGMYPREAALTDPQHRVFLEIAWAALEDAGYDPLAAPGRVGVFAGASMNTYFLNQIASDPAALTSFTSDYQVGSYPVLMGALQDTLATRVAYKLNLRGPAVNVQSACSTSLLAIAQACQSLITGQSDMALAGGVSITFPQKRGYLALDGGLASTDGYCRPFDARASGTVFGSGAAAVLLKRLDDALADGDHIYAVIRGTGVNNDGARKVGFAAPSVEGQADAIADALSAAGVDPATIGYVECHGTATPLGDPIEFEGLRQTYGGARTAPCALGSAKANVGHLDAAAGVTGVIKAALMLKHRTIPPLAHFEAPNPRLPDAQDFYFPTTLTPWESAAPRRAGVSSFGVGGTNVHAILEEAPHAARNGEASAQPEVLVLSARSEDAVAAMAGELAAFLEAPEAPRLADVAHTLQAGRRAFAHRVAVSASFTAQAAQALRAAKPARASDTPPPVVFLFPGQGAQYAGMACAPYAQHAVFRAAIDAGAALMAPLIGEDLRELLLAERPTEADEARLKETRRAQPALYLMEVALAKLWISWGVQPASMVGHSIGEFAAACIAGVFSFEEGCRLVAARALAMEGAPRGAMLAVRAPEASLAPLLGEDIDVAAVNAPNMTVASGSEIAIAALEARLDGAKIAHRRLHTSHAFHSRLMDSAVANLRTAFAGAALSAGVLPYASCVTGAWAEGAQQRSPDYWADHCRAPVLFGAALKTAAPEGAILLEVGPGATLTTLAAQVLPRASIAAAATSTPAPGEGGEMLSDALAKLWRAGAAINWRSAFPRAAQRIPLPTYAFARKRHWIDAPNKTPTAQAPPAAPPITPIIDASPPMTTPSPAARLPALEAALKEMLEQLSGDTLPPEAADATFLEMGFDSLFLGQVARALENKYAIKITFRQLLSDYKSIPQLAAHLDAALPPEAAPAPAASPQPAAAAPVAIAAPVSFTPSGDGMTALFQMQLQAMQDLAAQQIRALQGAPITAAPIVAPIAPAAAPPPQAAAPRTPALPAAPAEEGGSERFRAYKPSSGGSDLTPAQQAYIDALIAETTARTPRAKAATQQGRAALADPRTVAGFRPEWKEIVYPIFAERAEGAYIWDIDGNRYIDLVNGYGQTAFGHAPKFVVDAVAAQLAKGFAIGPQSPLAGEVAQLFCDMTGMERATFCNTGSEAVMAAMRLARAVTGRDTVVVFANDYHGQFDEVLVKPGRRGAPPKALPIAPGIPIDTLANMVVLPYGEDESLTWIAQNADKIAAAIVEPVQSRHPELRPVAFLRALRDLTAEAGAALVFDEVVTGFRVHPRGMQAVFNIQADMATYGKVVGGGMPIGVLAGSARFMDALDGGAWSFGDDSEPQTAPTFFAGTFVRHPLTLAAVKAVLLHLKAQGGALQDDLAARMGGLVARVNADLARRGLKTRLESYSSWFYAAFSNEDRLGALLYAQMRALGVHIQEAYPCFLTTAHTDADIDAIVDAFAHALNRLQAAGILVGDGAAPTAQTIAPPLSAPGPREAPMTEPQMEIWMAAQAGDEASCAFNESLTLTLEGPLDIAALSAALDDVVARHDALRAHFPERGRVMRIADLEPFELEAEPAPLADIVAQEARTPFDLEAGPLMRARLAQSGAQSHALVLTAHHIVCDGWSFNIILNDLAELYRARTAGAEAALAPAPSFAAHAQAESGADNSAAARYWLDQFADLPKLPDLPTDRRRTEQRDFSGATYTTAFDAAFLRSVKTAGGRNGATLFTTLLGALQALAGRLSNETDIVVATPTAGQSQMEENLLVGHCVNFLPMRAPFDWSTPFASHLGALQARVLAAADHQNFTYGTLVQQLRVPRTPGRLPLTELQFNLERLSDDLDFGAVKAQGAPNPKAYVNFDIFLNCIESAAGLRLDVDYNTALYDEATIARWLTHYRALLEGFVANPQQEIGRLPLHLAADLEQLIDGFNATARDYPKPRGVHELVSDAAKRTPQAVACADAQGEITYAALEARANQLARRILETAPGARGRIAVALNRSRDLVAALLAVMKAGHAYVPLDPAHPAQRLEQIMAEADVSALICDDDALAALASGRTPAIRVDQIAALADDATPPLSNTVAHGQPAYVIFTSGSTGAPKGVEVPHHAVVNLLASMQREPGFNERDTLVAVTTVSFDIAVLEIFLPLISGGKVVIASKEDVQGVFGLVDLIRTSGATVLQATPTLWRILMEAGLPKGGRLKLLCGGEPLPRDVADALLEHGDELWNLYGPTETTIWSSAWRVAKSEGPILVGAPIANTALHVLDARDELAPIGVAGRLFIGGDGLANGYFRKPDLTARAYRTIALGGGAPQRLYDTGDMAHRLPSGEIQLLGRADLQIKLRGFRIELEEIEAVLRTAPGVTDAAVAVTTATGADPRLVGYYVGSEAIAASELTAHVAARLPNYMTPALWVRLDALPQTRNGKLDRKALPAPALGGQGAAPRAPKPPSTELERRLVDVWSEVLKAGNIGVDDNIFSLGADSLHLFRIAARLSERGIALAVKDILRRPTIEALAAFAEAEPAAAQAQGPSLKDFRHGARRRRDAI